MQFDISYNQVKVTDPVKAQGICDRYEFQGATFVLDEQQLLQYLVPDENLEEDDRWPKALLVDDMPDIEDFEDENAYLAWLYAAFLDKGEAGFESFLREMSPLLQEPLFILAVGKSGFDSIGTAWYADPSGKVDVRNAQSR